MTESSPLPAPSLMPLLRYRELATAMSWLEQAFGFEKQIAVTDNDGAIIYGQMTYRGSLLMMGAVRDTDLDKLMRQPDEVGGVETQSCYLVVDDADAHHARAREAGAEIVLELKSDGLGRRGYSCRDLEGHIWNFGTYNPGKGMTMAAPTPPAPAAPHPEPPRRGARMLMGLAGLLVALGTAGWWFAGETGGLSMRAGGHAAAEAEDVYAELAKVRAEKRKAEAAAEEASAALEAERTRRLALEANSGTAVDKLAEEEHARRSAEATAASLREELQRTQEALDRAIEARRVSEEKLAVKSASSTATPAGAEAQASQASMDNASGIETSATRTPTVEEGASMDDDEEARTVRKAPRARAPKRRRSASITQTKYPAYVIDMKHVWPYESWSH